MTTVAAPAPPITPEKQRPQKSFFAPLLLVVGTVIFWAMTLNNGIFIDESLYIRTGRAYIEYWDLGKVLPQNAGQSLSGLPVLYPVLAGFLDMVGGLMLVRLFSLACILLTMALIHSITSTIFNRRAGLIAAAIFGFTGPVLYVAYLGTFDALVILLMACAWRLGMRDGWTVLFLLAPLLTLMVATKYTAYVFVPSLLVLSLFRHYTLTHSVPFRQWLRPHLPWKRIVRAVAVGFLTADFLYIAYLFTNQTTRDGLAFTTTNREALSPVARGDLATGIPDFIWPIFFAALLGLFWLIKAQRWSAVLWSLVLIGTALLLPVAQIKLGEGVSFQKHMAYSAMFLAPLAGWGLARPWKLSIWTPVLTWCLIVVFMWGAFRSHDLIQYPDVRPVAEKVKFTDGTYLSSSADSLSYYTSRDPDVVWETTFGLYDQGADATQMAVWEQRYDTIIIHAGATGSTIQDEGQKLLLDTLSTSDYELETVGEKGDQWLIYTK